MEIKISRNMFIILKDFKHDLKNRLGQAKTVFNKTKNILYNKSHSIHKQFYHMAVTAG